MIDFIKKTFRVLPTSDANTQLIAIAWMSFFWSTASLMIFSLLPTFIVEVLGLSKFKLGMIEGVSISLAFLAKIISGIISDRIKARRPLIIIGTVATFVMKALFALATSGASIFLARATDRIAKGIRTAPTDALIADIAPKQYVGGAYGVRQSLYTLGAVVGSLIASFFIYISNNNYRFVFTLALIPAALAVVVAYKYVHDACDYKEKQTTRLNFSDLKDLPATFWHVISVSSVLMLARFSESFLSLRGRDVGITLAAIPLLMVGYEIMHSIMALPIGKIADRHNRKKILLCGIFVLMLTNFTMVSSNSVMAVTACFFMAGIHMGMTQGLMSTLIAENTTQRLRGTAFSIYYFTTGVAVFIANPLAGFLNDAYQSSKAPFFGGLIFTSLAFLRLFYIIWKK